MGFSIESDLPDDELAEIEKMWQMPAASRVIARSEVTKQSQKPWFSANVKKLISLISVVILVLSIIIVPMTRRDPAPVSPARVSGDRPPLTYRILQTVKPVTDFLVKGLSAHGPTDVIKISPGNFSIKHQVEITAYNALHEVPANALVRDYYLVFVFESELSKSTQLQIFLKNNAWRNLYAYPASPRNGKIVYHPGKDPCNVCDFEADETKFSDIPVIGIKVWGGDPSNALNNLKEVYLIRKDIKLEDALRQKKPAPPQKEEKPQEAPKPAPLQKLKTTEEKLPAEPQAIPQQPKKQKPSAPDTIEVPLDIPNT